MNPTAIFSVVLVKISGAIGFLLRTSSISILVVRRLSLKSLSSSFIILPLPKTVLLLPSLFSFIESPVSPFVALAKYLLQLLFGLFYADFEDFGSRLSFFCPCYLLFCIYYGPFQSLFIRFRLAFLGIFVIRNFHIETVLRHVGKRELIRWWCRAVLVALTHTGEKPADLAFSSCAPFSEFRSACQPYALSA